MRPASRKRPSIAVVANQSPWRVRGTEATSYFRSRHDAEAFRSDIKSKKGSDHKAILERQFDGLWRGVL
jgi:hypothetical protein